VEYHQLVPVVAVNAFLVSRNLHWPLEALSADIATMRFDGKVRATDVITQRCGIFELCRADVTHTRFSTIQHRLLNSRIKNVLDHSTVPSILH